MADIASRLRVLGRRWQTPAPRPWFATFVVLVLCGLPWALHTSSYTLTRWEAILSLLLAAVGLNIVTGFAGQLSLGPGAVFGVGAYAAAVLADKAPRFGSLPLLWLVALVTAAAVGVVIGVPALRVGGFYLGMVTLYLALLLPQIVSHWSVTGGQNGISLFANLDFVRHVNGLALYEVTALVLLAAVGFSGLLLHSPPGRRFTAIRTSEIMAESVGIVPYRTKLLAFLISALPAGVGGGMYVYSQQLISPNTVDPTLSINLLAAVVIGGLGRIWGPLLGGVTVLGLDQLLSGFHEYELVVFGALLIAIVLRLPQGLAGLTPSVAAAALRPRRRRTMVSAEDWRVSPPTEPRPPVSVRDDHDRLRLEDAERAFGGVRALGGVTLELRAGQVHGLIGPNGSGKTTLLNLVSGFYRMDAGLLWLGDEQVHETSAATRARKGLARTFQTPKLIDDASLLENVMVAADLPVHGSDVSTLLRLPAGRRRAGRARQRAMQCLGYVGLSQVADRCAGEIPHPAQRLLEVARAIAQDPRFVLLDEPAAGLGPRELQQLGETLRGLAAAGVGVLLVEHNMPFVVDVADEVTVLHQGRVISQGLPAQVADDPVVAQVYLGEARP